MDTSQGNAHELKIEQNKEKKNSFKFMYMTRIETLKACYCLRIASPFQKKCQFNF